MTNAMIICYIVIAVLVFSVGVYSLGRAWAAWAEEGDKSDLFGPAVLAFFVSIFWLPVVALGIVIMPFVLLYRMGKRHGKTALEKKQLWETLSK